MSRSRKNRRAEKRTLSAVETKSPLEITYLFDPNNDYWGAMVTYQKNLVEFLLEDTLNDLAGSVKEFLQTDYPKENPRVFINREITPAEKQQELAVFINLNHLV